MATNKGSKRGWFQPAFTENAAQHKEQSQAQSAKKICTEETAQKNNSKILKTNLTNSNLPMSYFSSNWLENLAPTSISDLAIHHKKIEDVQVWLSEAAENKLKNDIAPILLITGPTGSGKTITLKVIAESLNYDVTSWTTPEDVDLVCYFDGDDERSDGRFYQENQADRFEEFLSRCSRYKSLFSKRPKRLILVKDFPNIFLKKPEAFHQCIERYFETGKCPLIFIVTDTNSRQLNFAFNLFPEELRIRCMVDDISFNPVASTFQRKALKRICDLMAQPEFAKVYQAPTPELLDSILLASEGDLRNAVINLHFSSQRNPVALQTEPLHAINSTKRSKKPEKTQRLKSIGKDSNITLMHALGRVLYPKLVDNFDSNASVDQTKVFSHQPDEIVDQFFSQPSNFVSFLFTNYPGHFASIENCQLAANILSSVDLFLSDYRNEKLFEIGLQLAIRGLMVANETPAPGKRMIKGYKKLRSNDDVIRERRKKLSKYDLRFAVASKQLALEYNSFIKIIR